MEAATEAVKESDGFVIERVKTLWKNIKDGTSCSISLPKRYCKARQLEFHPGDLVCARVSYSETNLLSSSRPSQNDKVSFQLTLENFGSDDRNGNYNATKQ